MVCAKIGPAGSFSERLACLGYSDEAHLAQAGARFCLSSPWARRAPRARGSPGERGREELRLLPTFLKFCGCHALKLHALIMPRRCDRYSSGHGFYPVGTASPGTVATLPEAMALAGGRSAHT